MNREKLAKEILIKDFIQEKYRTPTQQEIDFIYNEYLKRNPNSMMLGINAGTDFHFNQQVNKESSADNFNDTIERVLLEQEALNTSLEASEERTESIFRMYNNKFTEELSNLKKMTKTINRNLLLHSKDDIYTHGMVEGFQDYDKINFNESNIYMFNGKVTLGFAKVAGENFDSRNISYRVSSRSGSKVTQRNLNNITEALNEDGSFFKVLAFSEAQDETVDFYVDLAFDEPRFIDTLKFTIQAVESNSKISYQCFYSQNDLNYTEVFESTLVIENNENYVEINQEAIKSIRLVFSKDGYDYRDGDQYVYIFSLDFLGGTTKAFKINEESVLSLGPYELFDEDNAPVNFTMGTIKGGTCCIVPDKTSIDFYLSKDKTTWFKADYNATAKQVIQFEESEESFDDTGYFKRYENSSSKMIIENFNSLKLNILSHQRLLNFYIEKKDFKNIVKKSFKIKRNFCKKQNQELYSAKEGWFKSDNSYYCTNINIKSPEGRYFDFGEQSCLINKKQVSGKHFLPYGLHSFKTSEENYHDLNLNDETIINSERQLQEKDILYPYNHKYIVEGYKYSPTFNGRKVYRGADEVYSFDVKEVSNQRFLNDKSLESFTFVEASFQKAEETINAMFIMINIKETSGEAKLENYKLECKKRNTLPSEEPNNKLYIKAILKSLDTSVTPKIDQIQVRVI